VTKRSRAIAILLAFVFGMAYFIETTFLNQYHIIFLMIAIIALAYSFRKRQDEEN
jgi:4-hydroxybenzoate polyprenyltransferase